MPGRPKTIQYAICRTFTKPTPHPPRMNIAAAIYVGTALLHAMTLHSSIVDVITGAPGSDAAAAEATANISQREEEEDGCMRACRGANLVIFNLFALEAYHVSEAYNVSWRRKSDNNAIGCGIYGAPTSLRLLLASLFN